MTVERFFLGQDTDGTWYMIPVSERENWETIIPLGSVKLERGPESLTFEIPCIEGE